MMIRYFRFLAGHERSRESNRHLGLTLAFVAGAVNAGGYLAVSQYTSHMTGILSSMSDNLALSRLDLVAAGAAAWTSFLAGAATCAVLINWARRRRLHSQYAIPLMLEAALLLVFGLLGANLKLFVGLFVPATVLLLCYMMGLQNAIITKVSNAEIRTTHMTGNTTDLGIELGKLLYWNRDDSAPEKVVANREKMRLLAGLIGLFVLGGAAGAMGFKRAGFSTTIPLAVLLFVIAIVPVWDDLSAGGSSMSRNIPRRSLALFVTVGTSAMLAGCATPGVTAAVRRDPARLREVLDRPNHGGEDLPNLLSNSISFDCAECVTLLLNAGAKPGADLLSAAVLAGHEKIARLLVDGGADPAAAMSFIHAQTRKWAAGAGIPPEDARRSSDFFKKLERESAAKSDAPLSVAAALPESDEEAKPANARIAPSFREEKRADDYALVIGVETYDGLPAAAYARRDAEAAADFVEALGVPGSNVVTLTGVHATRSGLAKNIEGWLADNADGESTVYFYFAGRGAPDPKSGQGYLVPFDGDPRYLEQTAYPLKRLYEKLGELKAKRVIAILDTNFSGNGGRSALAPGAGPASGAVDAGFNSVDGKIALLAAADQGQRSGISEEQGHGLFSYFLFDGLNGAAKDASGHVTLKSAFEYAKAKVISEARRRNRVQVPLFESGGTATDGVVLRAKPR